MWVFICVTVQAIVAQDLHYLTFLNVHCRHLVRSLGWQIAATAYTWILQYIHNTSVQDFLRLCAQKSSKFVLYLYMFFLSESGGLLLCLMPLCAFLLWSVALSHATVCISFVVFCFVSCHCVHFFCGLLLCLMPLCAFLFCGQKM
jgi:uncharacterized membrane protein